MSKAILYVQIALHVASYYLLRPSKWRYSPFLYLQFLWRASILLFAFRHGKAVRVRNGWKIHLYLPAYPSPAFFHAIEGKLLQEQPGPITVVYSITRACRYKCPHCYQRYDYGVDMSDEMLVDVASQLNASGVAMFDIEGGEPFLRYDRLLKLVRSIGPKGEIWVNTSGDGATPERLTELREGGLFGLMVSVHSPDSQAHDRFTGIPGAFDNACNTLKLCKELGMVAAMNTVLCKEDLEGGRLDDLMALAKDLGCQFVQLIHPKPSGAWLGDPDSIPRDCDLVQHIRVKHLEYNRVDRRSYPSLAAQVFEEASDVFGCSAGAIDRFYVNANGEVQPCEFLNISFGNLNQDSWSTIFSRMREVFSKPCTDWLCCSQAASIQQAIDATEPRKTPLPWAQTKELVKQWQGGQETPLYKRLGIYRESSRKMTE